jgi:hypothetical protein
MRHLLLTTLAGMTIVAWLGVAATAHHSFAATYLESDTVEVEGEVVEFQYKNPHTWVGVQAPDPFGRATVYSAEWGSVSALERQGVLKNTLRPGDRVTMWVSPNRNPSDNRVRLKRIRLPDGRTLGGQQRIDRDREDAR